MLCWRSVVFDQQYRSFEEWDQKHRSDPQAYANYQTTASLLDQFGMCVREGLVDFDMLASRGLVAWTHAIYPKVKPVIDGFRRIYNDPGYHRYSDYLYEEIRRRYPDAGMSSERARLILGVDK